MSGEKMPRSNQTPEWMPAEVEALQNGAPIIYVAEGTGAPEAKILPPKPKENT